MKLRFEDIDNLFATTLDSGCSDSDLTIYLNSIPSATEGLLVLDAGDSSKREVIYYNAVGANYVSCPASGGRGQAGTSAQSHSLGSVVKMNFMREHLKPLRDAIFTGFMELNYAAAYGSASTITISSDLTAIFTPGRKVKLTFESSGVKYFTVVSSAYSSPDTTITLFGDTAVDETIIKIEMDVNPQAYSENDLLILNEKVSAPGTPPSGKGYMYYKNDGNIYHKNDSGEEGTFGDVTKSGTETLTNKRITPRVGTITSSATPSINSDDYDMFTITALAGAITSFTTNLSGTPTNGQKLIIRIKDNGTARAITWGASFASRGATLPTTTVANKYLYIGLIYNSVAGIWDCVAVSQEE